MSSVTVGMIYLWDLRNNALIRSFAQVGDEVGIFPSSSLQPGGCGSLRSGNRDTVEGCHRLATTAEGEKLLKPRSPGRVPEPAAPLQYQPPLQSSSDPVRPGRVQPPCKCPQVPGSPRGTPHTHLTSLPAAEGWEPPRGNRAPVGHCPRPPQTSAVASRSAPQRHPES